MKKALIIAVILAVAVAVPLLRNRGSAADNAVTLETVQERTIRASILASGKLSNEEEVKLSTEVIGKVSALYVKEGDRVEQGQLLLQIDDEAPLAMVEQQRASTRIQEIAIDAQKLRLANLETQWERQRALHERKLIDDNTFETISNDLELARLDVRSREASLEQAHALLEESEKNLAKTRVFAPIAGVVTSLDIKVGEMAISSTTNVPGSSLMTIANPASINVEVNVDEADIADVAVGQEAEIVAIAYPDQPMKGRVESIAISAKPPETAQGQAASGQSLSFTVKISFTDIGAVVLRPGMSSRAEIFTSQDEAVLAAPIQALQIEEDRSTGRLDYSVYRYEDGAARKVPVKVGIADDIYQEVTEGLSPGDRIVVGPDRIVRNLEDGDPVVEAPAAGTDGEA